MGIGSSKEGFSVFGSLNCCVSPVGRRLLRTWFLRPIIDLKVWQSGIYCPNTSTDAHPTFARYCLPDDSKQHQDCLLAMCTSAAGGQSCYVHTVQRLPLTSGALLQGVSARQDGIDFFMQNPEAVQTLRKIVRTHPAVLHPVPTCNRLTVCARSLVCACMHACMQPHCGF